MAKFHKEYFEYGLVVYDLRALFLIYKFLNKLDTPTPQKLTEVEATNAEKLAKMLFDRIEEAILPAFDAEVLTHDLLYMILKLFEEAQKNIDRGKDLDIFVKLWYEATLYPE